MEIKGLSDLVQYQGQFIRISSSPESTDLLGYLDKTIWVGPQSIVLFFFPIRKVDALNNGPMQLTDKTLKERSIQVEKLHPVERLDLKIKVERKEIFLAKHSDSEALKLLKQAAIISRL